MQCRRHFGEATCPFCGGEPSIVPNVARATGRLSRAAVFAGALVMPGCKSDSPPADKVAQVPVPAATDAAPIAPPIDAAAVDAAEPPADAVPAAPGVITGKAIFMEEGFARLVVTLRGPDGTTTKTKTDASGRYTFNDVAPGEYTVEWLNGPPPRPLKKKRATVTAGGTIKINLGVDYDPFHPLPMPYGAPPARMRLV